MNLRQKFYRLKLLILLILTPVLVFAHSPDVQFPVGETLEYSAWINFMKGGKATLAVLGKDTINNEPALALFSETVSTGFVETVYKAHDTQYSWMHASKFHSMGFKKDVNQGRYKRKYSVDFLYKDSLAISNRDTVKIERFLQDNVSLFYRLRQDSLFVGKRIPVSLFDNDKSYASNIIVKSIERIQVPAGKFECFKLEPEESTRKKFKYDNHIIVYISTDSLRIPVKIMNKASFGKVILKLEKYIRPE